MAKKYRDLLVGSIPFLVILFAWTLGSYLSLFPGWMIPTPATTAITFFKLVVDGTMLRLVWASLQNALLGFAIALFVSLVLGILIGSYRVMRKMFYPFFATVYIVPSLAWLPLVILLLGFTKQAVIFLIFFSSFKKMIYSVVAGVRNVNSSWILAGKNLGLNKFEITRKIILPAALPQIITGIRMGFSDAWKSLVGIEMLIAGSSGLGRFIWTAQWYFDFDKVFSGILVIALVGFIAEQFIFKQLEDRTLFVWGFVGDDRET